MKKVLFFVSAAVLAFALAACTKPAGDQTPADDQTPAEAPVADFEYAVAGLEVTFTNKSQNAVAYKWNFGDEETSKEASPKHVYAAGGTYTVKLTAANADGATNSKEASITLAGAPKAYFAFEAQTDRAGNFGRTIDFDASGSENAASITWDFGDESEGSTDFKPSHTFPDYAKYTVKATVTGETGETDTYEAEVEVIAYNELLKGGSMEEDDEQYWTFYSTQVAAPYAEPDKDMTGLLSWTPTFGYTDDGPSGGEGGCLRLSSDSQDHDQANNAYFYQAIEVVEGDYLELSAQMKWNENTNDCGLLWFGLIEKETSIGKESANGSSVVEMYNYWNSAYDNPDSEPVPAFDGDFGADENYIAKNAELELGYSNAGEPVAHYWVQKTGTLYFYVDLRSVWGSCHGPGRYYYFDNLSVKVVAPPAEEEEE